MKKIKNKNKIIKCGPKPLDWYCKVSIVATLVTFGISSLWGSLLFGESLLSENKNQETKLALDEN